VLAGDYAAPVSELEPKKHPKKELAPRHIPQVVVPVPLGEVRDFMQDALRGTSLVDPLVQVAAGWVFFEPHVRFTPVDAAHTRIELDVAGKVRGAETLLFVRRRGEIDRFFVAIQDELDRRARWRPQPHGDSAAIEGAD
jgi:hypothetical protein